MWKIAFLCKFQQLGVYKNDNCPNFPYPLRLQKSLSVTALFAVLDKVLRCLHSHTHENSSGIAYSLTNTGKCLDNAHS